MISRKQKEMVPVYVIQSELCKDQTEQRECPKGGKDVVKQAQRAASKQLGSGGPLDFQLRVVKKALLVGFCY